MRYFIDTEFIEGFHKPLFGKKRHFIDLISIGIVCKDGREFYAISKDFDLKSVWNKYDLKRVDVSGDVKNIYPEGYYMKKVYWLREKVLKPIFDEWRMDINGKIVRLDLPIALNEDKFTYKNFKKVIKYIGKSNKQIAEEIRNFVMMEKVDSGGQVTLGKFFPNGTPISEFYGYFADYDWCLFCSLFGRMIDLPTGFPMYCIDLKQMLDEIVTKKQSTLYASCQVPRRASFKESMDAIKTRIPKQENEHNALADAKWNKKLYEFLQTL